MNLHSKALYLSNVDDVVVKVSDALEAIPHMSWMWSFNKEGSKLRPTGFLFYQDILSMQHFVSIRCFTCAACLLVLCHGLRRGLICHFPKMDVPNKPLTSNLDKVPFCTFFGLAKLAGENEERHC